MSKQSGKNKDGSGAYIKHVYPDVRIDMTKHGVNQKKIRRHVNADGVITTVRTLEERNARFAPSPHRLTNIMYYCNHYSKYEAYLK